MKIELTAPQGTGKTRLINYLENNIYSGVNFMHFNDAFSLNVELVDSIEGAIFDGVLISSDERQAVNVWYDLIRKTNPGFILIVANQK